MEKRCINQLAGYRSMLLLPRSRGTVWTRTGYRVAGDYYTPSDIALSETIEGPTL